MGQVAKRMHSTICFIIKTSDHSLVRITVTVKACIIFRESFTIIGARKMLPLFARELSRLVTYFARLFRDLIIFLASAKLADGALNIARVCFIAF